MKILFVKLLLVSVFLYANLSIDEDFEKYLNSGRLEEARKLIENIEDERARIYLEGLIAFYSGDYKSALADLEKSEANDEIIEAVRTAGNLFGEKKPIETPHFLIYIADEKDRIMEYYIPLVAEEMFERVGKIFNYFPERKVRIEVYPDRESFSRATTLKETEVLRTGIVGVSKFNKLMILTPRILLRGYDWRGTLTHEYIHYVVSAITLDQTPVWLQEAIARYFDGGGISIPQLWLLKRGFENNKIITLEEMHPSIAKLPSDEDAALAFAEVYTLMDYFIKNYGESALMELLNRIEAGEDALQSFEEIVGMDRTSIMKKWKKYALKLAKDSFPADIPRLKFKGEEKEEDKNYTLGNILLERGYENEAIFEYERSLKKDPYRRRGLIKLVNLYLKKEEFKRAREKCNRILKVYPRDYTALLLLGKSYLEERKLNEAKVTLEKALFINPFDVELHIYLHQVYEGMNDPRREIEEDVIRKLKSMILSP